jgi:hypothetical protein
MPCRSDYPDLTKIESELNTIYNIFDDLNGELEQYRFPHPRVYDFECNEDLLHQETQKLCLLLRELPDVTEYSLTTQRWWANHRINDFKRLIKGEKGRKNQELSSYEQTLLNGRSFLNELVVDAFGFITRRFNAFNEEQSRVWQKSITKASFVQVFSTYELFSELLSLKIKEEEIQDTTIFKDFEKSDQFWLELSGQGYPDWLSFEDQFELRRYFEKYQQMIRPSFHGRYFFEATPITTEENQNLVFTINDSVNSMRILRKVKSALLSFL